MSSFLESTGHRGSVVERLQDAAGNVAATLTPQSVQVSIDNKASTPVKVFLAHDLANPDVRKAQEYSVPAGELLAVNSGWIKEGRVAIIIRVGVDQAHILKMPHASKFMVELAPHGLHITSNDDIETLYYPDVNEVAQIETVPMVLAGTKFGKNTLLRRTSTIKEQVVDEVAKAVLPFNLQVVVHNDCATPVKVFLARDNANPTVEDSKEFSAAANASTPINTGYVRDAKATLIIRVSPTEAMIFGVPNGGALRIGVAPHGLHITSNDQIVESYYGEPKKVPNNETVPMLLRNQTFEDR